jgi:hypothetical protein
MPSGPIRTCHYCQGKGYFKETEDARPQKCARCQGKGERVYPAPQEAKATKGKATEGNGLLVPYWDISKAPAAKTFTDTVALKKLNKALNEIRSTMPITDGIITKTSNSRYTNVNGERSQDDHGDSRRDRKDAARAADVYRWKSDPDS